MNEAILDLMQRRYHRRDYNCFHFARDTYLALVGIDIRELFLQDAYKIAPAARKSTILLRAPQDPCLVLFSRPAISQTHIGVFFENSVLHLTENGAKCQTLHEAKLGFLRCTFFRPRQQV